MKPLFAAFTIVFGITMFAPAAQAEQVCMPADEMGAALIDWYGESPVSEPSATREQIWASSATGTWTMIKLSGDGQACVIAQGEDWNEGLNDEEVVAALDQ